MNEFMKVAVFTSGESLRPVGVILLTTVVFDVNSIVYRMNDIQNTLAPILINLRCLRDIPLVLSKT